MRTLTALVLTFTAIALFGCGSGARPIDVEEGQRRLEAALEGLPHVTSTYDVKYSMQGPFNPTSAWMDGWLRSDTEDDAANREILLEAGRRLVEAMHDNHPKDSAVRLKVITPGGRTVDMYDAGFSKTPSLDSLAEYFGIERTR